MQRLQIDPSESSDRTTGVGKVVVADDSAAVRRLVGTRLAADGYEVIEAEDGERAFQLVLSEQPDALVLDKVMPKMDGFEVVRRLREHEQGSEIPIIMLTERHKEEDVLDGLDLGVDEYMPKPFSPRELSMRLTRVLQRTRRRR